MQVPRYQLRLRNLPLYIPEISSYEDLLAVTKFFFFIPLKDFVPQNLYYVFWGGESVSGVKIAKKRREQLSPGPERAFFAVFDSFWDSVASGFYDFKNVL